MLEDALSDGNLCHMSLMHRGVVVKQQNALGQLFSSFGLD